MSGQGCLCQMGAGRLGVGSTRGQARASRLPGREAAAVLSSAGTSTARAIGPSVHHVQYWRRVLRRG